MEPITAQDLQYMIDHVFLPPKLPQQDDLDDLKEQALCLFVSQAAQDYCDFLPALGPTKLRWAPILKMLQTMCISHRSLQLSQETISSSIISMRPGDLEIFALLIRAQNAGIIMRNSDDKIIFEAFEVSPRPGVVMAAKGKLLCSYPGPAVAVPTKVVTERTFCNELASFLVQMNIDNLDALPTTRKAQSDHPEERDTTDPRYITQLLIEILRGMGEAVEVTRIKKRIADDVLLESAYKPWRRSSIWLLIRVALQTSLLCGETGHNEYKNFLVFMMARMVLLAVSHNLESDLVFCMRAKVSRRLYKLGSTVPKFVLDHVREAGEDAEGLLQGRWSQLQRPKTLSPAWVPKELNLLGDTHLSLSNSRTHLIKVIQANPTFDSSDTFQVDHSPRFRTFSDFCALDDDSRSKTFATDSAVSLADFERAIENDLDSWVDNNILDHSSLGCITISSCIDQYFKAAFKLYNPNPEDLSWMFLTIFDLWVALDKLSVVQCPLLAEFSPEIPPDLLDSLLLRGTKSLERLTKIQKYVNRRHRLAGSSMSIFTNSLGTNSFPVRYFEKSEDHKSLLSRIEADARQKRTEKLQELENLNKKHKALVTEARSLNHEYSVNTWGLQYHRGRCCKCSLEAQASGLRIRVHEWPLPDGRTEAKATVFELQVPVVPKTWRVTTYKMLRDMCKQSQQGNANPHVTLGAYQPLAPYRASEIEMSRVTIASTTKSFLESHYSTLPIPAKSMDVCVNNGLQYSQFDEERNIWIDHPFTDCSIARHCSLQLPSDGPYRNLQDLVDETSHTSNEVMANQADCPRDLTLHEYIAFGSLRSGPRLQWLNVAKELPARSLSFRSEAVHILLMQTAWQVGPMDLDGIREWHSELHSAQFGLVLLSELETLLFSIEGNWLEGVTARTVVFLTSRLLASASDAEVVTRAYTILRKARDVTFRWMRQLAQKSKDSNDPPTVQAFQERLCEMAATCRGTFDVEPQHLWYLFNSAQDIAMLVECAIVIHDNTPQVFHGTKLYLRRLLDRDRRLSHSLESFLRQKILEKRDGLDRAITSVWESYRPGGDWLHLNAPNDRWVTTRTLAEDSQVSQSVRLNLLDGYLLINGRPLSRLPNNIVNDPLYLRHFGQRILDIVPADTPGMEFMTRSAISGHQVFFGFRDNGATLVIRAKFGSEIMELIPHKKFQGDLPTLLIENHVHWLNLCNNKIEIRPINNLWTPSDDNWFIHFSTNGHSDMHKGPSLRLIDVRSPTMRMIAVRMTPLESKEYLTITYSVKDDSLSVALPRFGLCFFLNDNGELESQNMPGMLIDENQSSGTMFGLVNQLVLREKDLHDSASSRRVIIPHGTVKFTAEGGHVHVIVDTGDQARVRYHEYHINTDLGHLVDNSSLTSTLFKVYLHAVTSHCLPDPLTGNTGTEEALRELNSAGCLSFQTLGHAESGILRCISALTPGRTFYPEHLQVMQTVKWSCLSPTAQHPGFHTSAQFIMEHANRLRVFTGRSPPAIASPKDKNPHLLERAWRRNTMFLCEDITGLRSPSCEDVTHTSRDLCVYQDPNDQGVVATVSAMVHKWPSRLATSSDLFAKFKAWGTIYAPNEEISLHYTRDWIDPNLAQIWLSTYNLCREGSRPLVQSQLTFSLPTLAYTSQESRDLIPTILAFATVSQFPMLPPPSREHWISYNLSDGFRPTKDKLLGLAHDSAVEFETSDEASLHRNYEETDTCLWQRRRSAFKNRLDSQADELVNYFDGQWPCETPKDPSGSSRNSGSWILDIPDLMAHVTAAFSSWYRNKELCNHIQLVQTTLDVSRYGAQSFNVAPYTFVPCSITPPRAVSRVTIKELFKVRDVPEVGHAPSTILPVKLQYHLRPVDTSGLHSLLLEFQSAESNEFRQRYGHDLDQSRQDLAKDSQSTLLQDQDTFPLAVFTSHRNQFQDHVEHYRASIIRALSPLNPSEMALFTAGKWPRLTTRSLLRELALDSRPMLRGTWKDALAMLARALMGFQRSQRLVRLASAGSYVELYRELENRGYEVQEATQSLDWLLMQVEGNILVRPVQIQVAKEMISPTSNRNTALQLNMGEGKSSVIVPMVATVLSNGDKFVRVVVLKSLATQMFHLLVKRLCGLLNRRIFYMPFSRTTLTAEHVRIIQELNEECRLVGGVLLAQPEHILSFKLVGIDRSICATSPYEHKIADTLLESQRWLEANSRDILDESDELLYVRYQLVYTVGQQQPLEGHPERWTTIQQLFSLVQKHAPMIQQQFPDGIEVRKPSDKGSYSAIRIIQPTAGDALVSLISNDVINGALTNGSFHLLPTNVRQAALHFISEMATSSEDSELLEEYCINTGAWKQLLLLRGLLAHKILLYVLKERRWRVDFGLDLSRSLLAVPYKAKDVPSLKAEFGHPDVAIALTCISYYNQGLCRSQLDQCFNILHALDNPTLEYETWVHNVPNPGVIRDLGGVNTDDPEQWRDHLLPLFHRNHDVIDFFLSHVVFPKAAKTFPQKLATSGWDLAEIKQHITTGFSGTNDRRYILPTSIIQDDPVGQLSTNARVLTYLLQPENDSYSSSNKHLSADEFLEVLVHQTSDIRVLLDVGAQVLELQNIELAKHWLLLRRDMSAIIFFGDNDELSVLTHDGSVEAFISSPFNQQLDKCLVYLDDAHTRGTDLKLPHNYRAAVTLGPKVTKDRLLQGCMRMRKLGHGQSVMFFAPLEVDRAVRQAAGKTVNCQVNTLDILRWAMLETCKDIEHHISHWASQGVDHHNRQRAGAEFSSSSTPSVKLLASAWLQAEARSLESMYGLPSLSDTKSTVDISVPEIDARCRELGLRRFSDAQMDEEQERELHHEVEREREIERPPRASPADHQVHDHVRELVVSGRLPSDQDPAFVPILFPFTRTAAASREKWSRKILATKDFSVTIKGPIDTAGDYLRPVHWILSCDGHFVVLSPFEVNILLPEIRKSKAVNLHQYTPRVSRSMKSFDRLTFYCIPKLPLSWVAPTRQVKLQLNIWAGQLYLQDKTTYLELCNFLGLYTEDLTKVDSILIQNDGFIKPEHRHGLLPESPFTESPVPFLKELIGLRRKGMGFSSTPLGKILHARQLTYQDFD